MEKLIVVRDDSVASKTNTYLNDGWTVKSVYPLHDRGVIVVLKKGGNLTHRGTPRS